MRPSDASGVMQTLSVLSLAGPSPFPLAPVAPRQSLPLISLVVIVSNAIWWTPLQLLQRLRLGDVFHGLQYLAIVSIFHVKDQARVPECPGWFFHTPPST
jgi:hypothetical protein